MLKVLHAPLAASHSTRQSLALLRAISPPGYIGRETSTEADEHASPHKGTTRSVYDKSNADPRSARATASRSSARATASRSSCGMLDCSTNASK